MKEVERLKQEDRPECQLIRIGDFMSRDGMDFDTPDDHASLDDPLIEGTFLNTELRKGLFLHCGKAIEKRAFTATSFLREGLSCIFFLNGAVDVRIGDRRLEFRNDHRHPMTASAIMNTDPEIFRRASVCAQHVHHLVISATPEWLNLEGVEEACKGTLTKTLARENLVDHRWTPKPHLTEIIRQFFIEPTLSPELHRLYLEGRAVQVVAETLATFVGSARESVSGGLLTSRDRLCLERAKEFIATDPVKLLTVQAIAREAGMSATALQRLFRTSEGQSIFEHVRATRLERAFESLRSGQSSIKEASAMAGYSSSSNFATAFKRRFGKSPRQVIRGN